ncbi:MAG: hypothetical protein ACK5SP_02235 [bacterium]
MKLVIIFGLDHVEKHDQPNEAARLLKELAADVNSKLVPGTSVVVKDANGQRVGIADIHD